MCKQMVAGLAMTPHGHVPGPQVRDTLGGLCPWLRGLFPHGGVALAGGSGEGARPLRWSWALLRPGWVAPSPQQHTINPPLQSSPFPSFHPGSIIPWCCSPLPAFCIPVLQRCRAQRIGFQLNPALPNAGPNSCGIPMPMTSPGHGTPRQSRASSSALVPAGHSCLGTRGQMLMWVEGWALLGLG